MDFNNLEWHDAEILDLYINRKKPGIVDEVTFTIIWPNEHKTLLIFKDCYKLDIEMNFAIITPENILNAYMSRDKKELFDIRELWKNYNINLEQLKYYEIETNSTNSLIKICAMDFQIQELE